MQLSEIVHGVRSAVRRRAVTLRRIRAVGAVVITGVAIVGSGCHGSTSSNDVPTTCPPCVTNDDCSGGICAQFGSDTYCAPACPKGNECSSDRACAAVTSFSGDQVSVCVPSNEACGPESTQPDVGVPETSGLCGTLAPPSTPASCNSCGSHACQPNGCYGNWWCDTATNKCRSAPTGGCPTSDGGTSGGPYDGGVAPTGSVSATGGSVSRLYFAIVGDTRPATNNDTAGYPTTVITKIYQQMSAAKPPPSFGVSTGDYMFASPGSGQSAPQLDLYVGARAAFTNPVFPTMGNHECTGATASNCGPGTTNGNTSNFTDYLSKMLAPLGQTQPYYAIHVSASDGSWTAKFLFVAANAWTSDEGTWLDGAMSEATTYTFVIRHEPASATTAPGVAPSEAIMSKHPYTLAIVGHTHTYSHRGGREVIVGNGGAPLTGGGDYGFGIVSQRADGALDVDMINYATGGADPSFHFAVKADGSPAP